MPSLLKWHIWSPSLILFISLHLNKNLPSVPSLRALILLISLMRSTPSTQLAESTLGLNWVSRCLRNSPPPTLRKGLIILQITTIFVLGLAVGKREQACLGATICYFTCFCDYSLQLNNWRNYSCAIIKDCGYYTIICTDIISTEFWWIF